MSLASVAAEQSAALAAATTAARTAATAAASAKSTTGSATSGTSAAQSGQAALTALSGNFSNFLGMLMTQMKNQDPSSPMDTNQFTQELVQFSGVEQQINTNSSLTQLIQLTQSGQVMQGTAMTGKPVTVTATQIPLQNGTGKVSFTDPTAGPVAIVIDNANGQVLRSASVNATAGQNTWTWDGTDNSGNTVPDGAYGISVVGANTDGSTTPLTFSVTGTATGVQNTSSGLQLGLGALTVPFTAVQSVGS
ncbi:MAG: flagellar biosynthesis protein FlgD [Proteobacteria bacterium]|nr:flagellar biosynthesis protein FlgD [Pseudomonadota bacterium]